MDEKVRHFGSARPYGEFAEKYRKAGFKNPIPIPPKKKNPPPEGYTGHNAKPVDISKLNEWLDERSNWNIALHLDAGVELDGAKFDVIGIDVDHHPDDPEDPKNGGPQLVSLEKKLGKLTETWTSSARGNGIAGTRLFLAPAGLSWRGNCGKEAPHIDVISPTYRFTVVFPSFHPKAGQYLWYPPGCPPDGRIAVPESEIESFPRVMFLAQMPKKWVEFLTQGFTPYTEVAQDMDSSARDLKHWAGVTFAERKKMCKVVDDFLSKSLAELEGSDESHPVLTPVHYALLMFGAEGHTGWGTALERYNRAWRENVIERGKRGSQQADSEIDRSIVGALRKIKGAHDKATTAGEPFVRKYDPCVKAEIIDRFPTTPDYVKDPGTYDLTDDGNAEHFLDLYTGHLLYIANVHQKWIYWDNRWVVDEIGLVSSLFRKVRKRQQALANKLQREYQSKKGQTGSADLRKLWESWAHWARNSGMTPGVTRALIAARTVRLGISKKYEELDKDRRAVGAGRTVVRFRARAENREWRSVIEVVKNSRDLLITKNTGYEYVPSAELRRRGDLGFKLFREFLVKFQPMEDMHYFQKLMGSVLLGDVSNKFAIFFWGDPDTGKSTMLDVMLKAVGDYGDMRNPDLFQTTHLNPALASALPMRLIGMGEMGEAQVNAELFKTLTGGDRIVVELKGKNNLVSDYSQFTFIIATNKVPRVPNEDKAFRNRLLVIKFQHGVTEAEKIAGEQARAELLKYGGQACFSWLVEGAAKCVVEGLYPFPPEIRLASEEFATQLSDLGIFAEECIVGKIGGFVRNEDMLERFRIWADNNNFETRGWNMAKITRTLKSIGYKTDIKRIKNKDTGSSSVVRGFADIELVKSKMGQ